tara:strand:+ start:206 stop:325 length:120 start_codon:yes stop_codon:yes gene_type:complete
MLTLWWFVGVLSVVSTYENFKIKINKNATLKNMVLIFKG